MSIIDSFKTASGLLVKVHDADIKAEIQAALLNAQGDALELQAKVASLQDENAKIREELRSKNATEELSNRFFYARHAYWSKDEKDGSAYCPTCFDTIQKPVRLAVVYDNHGYCHACKTRHAHAYDGPKPKEGDSATIRPSPPVKLSEKMSRSRQMRNW